jgi:hypothetical protein
MPETTTTFHRVPAAKNKKGNELRTVSLGKGVKALYDPKRKIIVTYLFDKTKYTMKQAKAWVKIRSKSEAHLQVVELLSIRKGWGELYRDTKKEILAALQK